MPLGREVGLGPEHTVLDGTQLSPPKKEAQPPQFSAHVYCGQTVGWINMSLGMEIGLGPGHIVLDGDPAPLLKKEAQPSPNCRPITVVTKRLDGLKRHLVWR